MATIDDILAYPVAPPADLPDGLAHSHELGVVRAQLEELTKAYARLRAESVESERNLAAGEAVLDALYEVLCERHPSLADMADEAMRKLRGLPPYREGEE